MRYTDSVSQKEERKGLATIDDCVNETILGIEEYKEPRKTNYSSNINIKNWITKSKTTKSRNQKW